MVRERGLDQIQKQCRCAVGERGVREGGAYRSTCIMSCWLLPPFAAGCRAHKLFPRCLELSRADRNTAVSCFVGRTLMDENGYWYGSSTRTRSRVPERRRRDADRREYAIRETEFK